MNKARKILFVAVFFSAICPAALAQSVAVKTNLLHGAALTPNLSVEMGINMLTTLDVYGAYNWFEPKADKKWKHWIVQPEVRWWFCERFNGGFIGLHLHGGEFNVGGVGPFTAFKNNRYEGWFVGAGLSYGHQWILGNRWGLELELGLGYAHMMYDRFRCGNCSPVIGSGSYNYFGPTKIQASFVFLIK